ncbi:MAG: divergent PAP2 family protein [Clostridia bacterium]|nr:divergent PAP2 family protein [Clostridia bacterium]MBR6645886.1 divergent PAP2 family protein [Clostridia bacterium]
MTAVIGWFVAQLLKVIFTLIQNKRLDLTRFIGSGGMPSSHTSFVIALTTSIGYQDGVTSSLFAISAVLSFVVMYDASGVRRATGTQAKVINKLVDTYEESENIEIFDGQLKELIGHSPLEVLAGAILGLFIGIISYTMF